jgi:hypothetical protein
MSLGSGADRMTRSDSSSEGFERCALGRDQSPVACPPPTSPADFSAGSRRTTQKKYLSFRLNSVEAVLS